MSSHDHNDATTRALFQQLSSSLKKATFNENYSHVRVLLLFWQPSGECDTGYRDEGLLLGQVFADTFKFEVDSVIIPLEYPQLSVEERVSKEVIMMNKKAKMGNGKGLLILHYGGHGSNTNREGRAVWAP